jgi:hypothetical protein
LNQIDGVGREMLMRAARLGDDIDDFCVKCKRVMNHSVVSILNDAPAKVRCRTCHSDHDFRNEQPPPPKVDPRKAALFNQVLENAGLPVAPVPDSNSASNVDEVPALTAAAASTEAPDQVASDEKPKGRKKTKA